MNGCSKLDKVIARGCYVPEIYMYVSFLFILMMIVDMKKTQLDFYSTRHPIIQNVTSNDPVCQSAGRSVYHNFLKGGKLHFQTLVYSPSAHPSINNHHPSRLIPIVFPLQLSQEYLVNQQNNQFAKPFFISRLVVWLPSPSPFLP